MLKKILEQQGILNVDEYLTPPEQIPPPQPDPVQQMQAQMAAKQLELQERQTGVAEMRAQTDAAVAQAKITLDAEKAAASHALQSDNQDLREAQFAHKVKIDEGELEVLRRSTTDVRGIASPRANENAGGRRHSLKAGLVKFMRKMTRNPIGRQEQNGRPKETMEDQETLVRMGEEAECCSIARLSAAPSISW